MTDTESGGTARFWLVTWQDRLFNAYQRARYTADASPTPQDRRECVATAEAWREVCRMIDARAGGA